MSNHATADTQPLLWGRACLYGLAIEAILIVIFFVGLAAGMSARVDAAIAVAGSFALPLLFAVMLGRRLQARFVVHGALIGAAAFAIFMALNGIGPLFQPDIGPQSAAYWIAHALKILGGAAGGAIASRRHRHPL
jgi:Na+(H+)/acetate symporter ActP